MTGFTRFARPLHVPVRQGFGAPVAARDLAWLYREYPIGPIPTTKAGRARLRALQLLGRHGPFRIGLFRIDEKGRRILITYSDIEFSEEQIASYGSGTYEVAVFSHHVEPYARGSVIDDVRVVIATR